LVRALFDNNAAVRRASAKALGKIGDQETIKPLTVALKDADAGVRKFAEEAIHRLQTA
jgi:HEAT repeat protein